MMLKTKLLLIFILQMSVTCLYALTFSFSPENQKEVRSLSSLNKTVDIKVLEVKSKHIDSPLEFIVCPEDSIETDTVGFQILKQTFPCEILISEGDCFGWSYQCFPEPGLLSKIQTDDIDFLMPCEVLFVQDFMTFSFCLSKLQQDQQTLARSY